MAKIVDQPNPEVSQRSAQIQQPIAGGDATRRLVNVPFIARYTCAQGELARSLIFPGSSAAWTPRRAGLTGSLAEWKADSPVSQTDRPAGLLLSLSYSSSLSSTFTPGKGFPAESVPGVMKS